MRLQIDLESKVPIYVQVEDHVRALIAAGQLRPGEQLPTIRELAADLRVNYNTIARAYLELDRDGVISTQRGRGTFVAGVPDEEQMARKRSRKLHAVVRSALDEAHLLGYEPREIAEVFEEELADWQERNGTETVKNG
ncbi:MAG: GntR family transcriptional regulator [Anaerolineae bacterium]|jgi:GntR family transcriptional regulator